MNRAAATGRLAATGCVRAAVACVVLVLPILPLADLRAAEDPGFVLTATAADFDSYFPGQLANGYLSTFTSPRGTEANLAYLVAFMDYAKGDMSRPAAIPGWTEMDYSTGQSARGHFWMNQAPLGSAAFQDYRQVLNMHDATLTTRYRYDDHGRMTNITVRSFVSMASPHLAASRLSITPEFDGVVELTFALNLWAPSQPRMPLARLDGDQMQIAVAANNLNFKPQPPATPDRAAVWYHGDTHVLKAAGDKRDLTLWLDGRAERGLKMAEATALSLPSGVEPVSVKIDHSQYRLSLDLRIEVSKGRTYDFSKFVAVSRQDWGGDAQADLKLVRDARSQGFEALLAGQRSAWAGLWKSDIIIDGDPVAQRTVHSDLYYLLSNVAPDTAWGVGACGITTGYVGHVFWDSDTWMLPALLLQHPQRARSIAMFRSRTLPAAQARARERGKRGAKYPWESDPQNGTEQVIHAAWVLGVREIHVNADIALSQWQYWLATHDKTWLREHGWPVIRNVAEYWASRVIHDPVHKRYDIVHVTSVEEDYNDVPNDTYTNVSVIKTLRIASEAAALVGTKPGPRWNEIADKLYVPFSNSGQYHLDFDPSVIHDHGHHDDALLTFPPLDLAMPEKVRRNDYLRSVGPPGPERHAPTTMGMAPLVIAAAALDDTAETTRWIRRDMAADMLKRPFNVRTESVNNNTGYFLTGSAGFIQGLVYGLTGLRLSEQGLEPAYKPVLPDGWKSITLKNVVVRGKRFDIWVDRDANGKPRLRRVTR